MDSRPRTPEPAPILVVTGTDPQAQNHGALMRLRLTVESLAELAPVDLAVVRDAAMEPDGSADEEAHPLGASRYRRFSFVRRLSVAGRVRWALRPSVPLNLVGRRLSRTRSELRTWLADEYSLVWVFRADVFHAVAPVLPRGVPVVLDIDDLESEKLAALGRQGAVPGEQPSPLARARAWLASVQGRRNVRAWRDYERRAARAVTRPLVCSQEDLDLLGSSDALVVPNGYAEVPEHSGRHLDDGRPTILMQGSLTYPPNIDGAEYFVREVLPGIRERLPDAEVRLVGRCGTRVEHLGGTPGVVVTGYVDSIDDELERADLVVAPIRFGGGTRIKILEAFAHGIPVVSTSVGAHGLGVRSGSQAVLADRPQLFAEACVHLLTDEHARRRVTRAASEHFDQNFREDAVRKRIQDVVRSVWAQPGEALACRRKGSGAGC